LTRHPTLTEGNVARVLIRYSLPFLLSSFIHMAYSTVDVIILGWFASPASLSGAGNSSNLVMTLMSIFMGFQSGGMILLGQHYGAKDENNSRKALGSTIVLQFVLSIVGTVFILAIGRLLIGLINVPQDIDEKGLTAAGEAWNYMRVYSLGLVFHSGYGVLSSTLRALGDSKTPLIIVAISCCTNIVLDIIFIGVMQLGATGAAAATIIAQALSFVLVLLVIIRRKLPFSFTKKDIKLDWSITKTIFKLGTPISLQTVLNSLSFLVIASIINKMGMYASAANGIVNNLTGIYMVIPFALGSALSAISAQNLGAKKTDRALQSTKYAVYFSLAIAVPVCVFACIFPKALVSIMSPHPDVVKASAEFLIPFAWDCLLVSVVFCMNGFFNGCGITVFVAVQETLVAFAVRIPVSWAMSLLPGATLFHVGIGTPVATCVALIMNLIYYKVKLSGGRLAELQISGA